MPATQNDMMLSKFSRKDGLVLTCGVVTFFILAHIGEFLFESSVKIPVGIIIACSCWVISSRERYNATQQLNILIDKIHRENECLKSNLAEQDEMLAQLELKQLESENKLREENHLSERKCEEIETEMEKLITRSNEEIETVKTALAQHEVDSQMYKDRCISLTEHLRTAMTEGYSLETQLQTATKEIQQNQEEFEQYKNTSNKRYDAIKTELQIAWINFQKEREEYEENKMSSKKRFDTMTTKLQTASIEFQKQREIYAEYENSSKRTIHTMETQLQTVGIEFQKEHEQYQTYKKSSRKKIDTMETQLQTIWIEMRKERETYAEYEKSSKEKINTLESQLQTARLEFQKEHAENEEYKKTSRKKIDTMETQLQTARTEMKKERETYEEYKESSKKKINTMEMENNNYKELLLKNKENLANKLQGLQNTVATTQKELQRMKSEKISWTTKSNELQQTIKDIEKTQHSDFYSKRHVDAIYKLASAKTDYERLGISRDATKSDVNTAYKKLSILVHPDKNAAPGSEDAFKILQSAKNTLYKRCS
ncbi:myosin-9-like [Mytilus trossulus]|uniref:myosin-9-like n=1 Tax=Mytilus trossulus TaxID=6551 RepID=UPI003006964F